MEVRDCGLLLLLLLGSEAYLYSFQGIVVVLLLVMERLGWLRVAFEVTGYSPFAGCVASGHESDSGCARTRRMRVWRRIVVGAKTHLEGDMSGADASGLNKDRKNVDYPSFQDKLFNVHRF